MNLVSMPRSVNSDNMLNLDLNTESENQNDVKKHNFRTRKLTPRIMPSSGKIIRSTTVESIEEQDIETEQENIGEFERGLDGTFMIHLLDGRSIFNAFYCVLKSGTNLKSGKAPNEFIKPGGH